MSSITALNLQQKNRIRTLHSDFPPPLVALTLVFKKDSYIQTPFSEMQIDFPTSI